ncbi:MAG: lysine--tRNA ligase [Clostridiales Family XIII bacterium]|jgi:lysyl-tRNA synthetase class 2|nr:lysine--tRNA ligase [Clostridiales Family XIII bacterium]
MEEDIKDGEVPTEQKINEIEQKRREKLDNLKAAGKNPYLIERYDVKNHSKEIKDAFEILEGKKVKIAGRIMANRHMGKASFIDLQDKDGKIQVYIRKDAIGDEAYTDFLTYDIGDILGIEGEVFKTRHGEISVKATDVLLLSKSLRVLPNKWQGLKDTELKYRRRYIDLIMNPDVVEIFKKRTKIIKEIKRFLEEDYDYIEVDTPILTTIAGGASARPFETYHNTLDLDMKLRISNELPLKRLIVGGLDRVYEMGKMFRNEGIDKNHNPEFTSIEFYQAYSNLEDMMELTEKLVESVALKVNGKTKILYDGKEIELKAPWKRISMVDALKEKTGIDFNEIKTDKEAKKIIEENNIEVEDFQEITWGTALALLFEKYCEDDLIQPIFITEHPIDISPLAKKDPRDPRLTRRFEAYINGWEIANAFSELNDPIDQLERFTKQQSQLDAGDDEAHPMDMDYVYALEVGLPPTGGEGIGIDRLTMLITGVKSIRDIILFPTMK